MCECTYTPLRSARVLALPSARNVLVLQRQHKYARRMYFFTFDMKAAEHSSDHLVKCKESGNFVVMRSIKKRNCVKLVELTLHISVVSSCKVLKYLLFVYISLSDLENW